MLQNKRTVRPSNRRLIVTVSASIRITVPLALAADTRHLITVP